FFAELLLASKCFLQPCAQLSKEQTEISGGRFLEEFDDALTEVLSWIINRAGQMHVSPQIAAGASAKNFFRIRQPIQVFARKPKFDVAHQYLALDGNFSFNPEFAFLLDDNVLDVDFRIVPRKTERTFVQV